MKQRFSESNAKEQATAMIWGCAVGMFALCIPLTEVAQSGLILPTLVILGAVIGTATVWLKPRDRKGDRSAMTALEERIINLEAICTSLPEVDSVSQFLSKENY